MNIMSSTPGPSSSDRTAALAAARTQLDDWTQAALRAEEALQIPKHLMSFGKDGRGKPTKAEGSLYLSAVTFAYAVWESYVEDVVVELTKLVSPLITAELIPEEAKTLLAEKSTYELAVHPGWRELWIREVVIAAKGEDGGRYGMNTASFKNVTELFSLAGIIDALPEYLPCGKGTALGKTGTLPAKIHLTKQNEVAVKHCIDLLVRIRGEAVHTATTTDALLKNEVLWWSGFVRALHEEVDKFARGEALRMLGLEVPSKGEKD